MNSDINSDVKKQPPITYMSYRIRIRSSQYDPNWITEKLNVTPSWQFVAGEEYNSRRPDGSGGWKEVVAIRPSSVWGLTTKQSLQTDELAKHCAYLAGILVPEHYALSKLVQMPESFEIGLHLLIETQDYIFSDTIYSTELISLLQLSHHIDISTIFTGADTE